MCKERAAFKLRNSVLDPLPLSNSLLAEQTSESIYLVDAMHEELNSLGFTDFTQFMTNIGTKVILNLLTLLFT